MVCISKLGDVAIVELVALKILPECVSHLQGWCTVGPVVGGADGVGEKDMSNTAVFRDGHVLGDIVVEKVQSLHGSLRILHDPLAGLDPTRGLPACIYHTEFQPTLQPFDPLLCLDAQLEVAAVGASDEHVDANGWRCTR